MRSLMNRYGKYGKYGFVLFGPSKKVRKVRSPFRGTYFPYRTPYRVKLEGAAAP